MSDSYLDKNLRKMFLLYNSVNIMLTLNRSVLEVYKVTIRHIHGKNCIHKSAMKTNNNL